jgi:hypothetical protein
MLFHILDQTARFLTSGLAAHAHQRRDPGPEEPGPDGALVVGAVALPLAAVNLAAIARIILRQRAQADGVSSLSADAQDRLRGSP